MKRGVFKKNKALFLVCLVLLLLLTPFRGIALVFSWLLLPLLYVFHPFVVPRGVIWLTLIYVVSSTLGVLSATTSWRNVLVSFFIFLPVLVLCFIRPVPAQKSLLVKYQRSISKLFVFFLVALNIGGLISWIIAKKEIDTWGTLYGTHYEGVHGLGMLNIILLTYLFFGFLYGKKRGVKRNLLLIWILVSTLGCQYGLGLVCLFVAGIVYLLFKRHIKYLFIAGGVVAIGMFVLSLDTFEYERENLEYAQKEQENARKMIMYSDFLQLAKSNPVFSLLGTGAGGYSSRSALLLSPDHENVIKDVVGESCPPYFKEYIYSLWNTGFVSFGSHNDGTRNKPYSSLVALWAEFGLFFILIFMYLYIKNSRQMCGKICKDSSLRNYIAFLDIFMFVSLLSHLWLETTEFIVYVLFRYFLVATSMQCRSQIQTDNVLPKRSLSIPSKLG